MLSWDIKVSQETVAFSFICMVNFSCLRLKKIIPLDVTWENCAYNGRCILPDAKIHKERAPFHVLIYPSRNDIRSILLFQFIWTTQRKLIDYTIVAVQWIWNESLVWGNYLLHWLPLANRGTGLESNKTNFVPCITVFDNVFQLKLYISPNQPFYSCWVHAVIIWGAISVHSLG